MIDNDNIFIHDANHDISIHPGEFSWISETYEERLSKIKKFIEKETGYPPHKTLKPIRTLSIHVLPKTSMKQLHELAILLNKNYGIECFQIILRSKYHTAVMMFDWLDRKTYLGISLNTNQMENLHVDIIRKLRLPKNPQDKFSIRKFFQQALADDPKYFDKLFKQVMGSNIEEKSKFRICEALEYVLYKCQGLVK
jgi:hypothetical protein